MKLINVLLILQLFGPSVNADDTAIVSDPDGGVVSCRKLLVDLVHEPVGDPGVDSPVGGLGPAETRESGTTFFHAVAVSEFHLLEGRKIHGGYVEELSLFNPNPRGRHRRIDRQYDPRTLVLDVVFVGPSGSISKQFLSPKVTSVYGDFSLAALGDDFKVILGGEEWRIAPLALVLGIVHSFPDKLSGLGRIWVRTSVAELQALGFIEAAEPSAMRSDQLSPKEDILAVFDVVRGSISVVDLPTIALNESSVAMGVKGAGDLSAGQRQDVRAGLFLVHFQGLVSGASALHH